jgi:mRNA interferase MazF
MTGGDIIITALPQADGVVKNRPSLVLCPMRPFGDLLVCGISTQLQHAVAGFDEIVGPESPDFNATGLVAPSLIRLGYVTTLPLTAIKGRIGKIDPDRHRRLVAHLARHLDAAATA